MPLNYQVSKALNINNIPKNLGWLRENAYLCIIKSKT